MDLSIGISFEARVGERQSQNAMALMALHAALDMLNSCSPSQTEKIMDELVRRGDIRLDYIPADDELLIADEEDLESELDARDDDEPPDMGVYDGLDEGGPFADADDYRLEVVAAPDGTVRCLPPANVWSTARGVSAGGKKALKNVSSRVDALRKMADWLEREYGGMLAKGMAGFMEEWKAFSQKEFLDGPGEGILKDVKKTSKKGFFSKFIRNARLSWPEGSIPLQGAVFVARDHGT